MTVRELLARVTSRELSEWMAYEQVAGPLGSKRIDYAAALISAVLANVNSSAKSKAFSIDDFMVDWLVTTSEDAGPEGIWTEVERAHKAFTTGR
ncbi:MAG: phage tail assembly protein T [Pseudonocardiaceae bacterium]